MGVEVINWNKAIAIIQIASSALMFGILIRHHLVDRAKAKKFSKLEKIKLEKWRHGVFLFFSTTILIFSVVGYCMGGLLLDFYCSIYFTALSFLNLITYLFDKYRLKQEIEKQPQV